MKSSVGVRIVSVIAEEANANCLPIIDSMSLDTDQDTSLFARSISRLRATFVAKRLETTQIDALHDYARDIHALNVYINRLTTPGKATPFFPEFVLQRLLDWLEARMIWQHLHMIQYSASPDARKEHVELLKLFGEVFDPHQTKYYSFGRVAGQSNVPADGLI